MVFQPGNNGTIKKRGSGRELTTALFLVRCAELGISAADMELLTVGTIVDMFAEKQIDEGGERMATQDDFEKFKRL